MDSNLMDFLRGGEEEHAEDLEGLDEISLDSVGAIKDRYRQIKSIIEQMNYTYEHIEAVRRDAVDRVEDEYEQWAEKVGKTFPASPAFYRVKNMRDQAMHLINLDTQYLTQVRELVNQIIMLMNDIEGRLVDIVREVESLRRRVEVYERRNSILRRFEELEVDSSLSGSG